MCLERCAGRQAAAVGAMVRITGRRLGRVTEVHFRSGPSQVWRTPTTTGRHRVLVRVPNGARTGRPKLVDAEGHRTAAPRLRIVPPGVLPPPGSFTVIGSRVRPPKAFFDAKPGVRLRYRFRSYGALDVTVKLVRRGSIVRTWTQRSRLPYTRHRLTWNGMRKRRNAAPRGQYRFKLKARGHRGRPTPRFRLADGKFPVRGPHGYGGAVQRFGAPRSGGRIHQGQDLFAACGTPVVAARGGRVQSRGSDPVLYGNWVVIDGRGTRTDYRYAHFIRPASARDGERVRTGERIGRVGKTGNARTVGCMLHFEAWPSGWHRGGPVDPLPILRRWDSWS
jgi:murein DD-endopeptidase MepM/ murein hydrolase activator NlpD